MEKPLALIVEDDAMLGEIYVKTLEPGFEVELIEDGSRALRRIVSDKPVPDLVVLDINLPGESGVNVFKHLRTAPGYDKTRVIICSANAQAVELLEHSADLTLVKPVSPSQLRTLANRLVIA